MNLSLCNPLATATMGMAGMYGAMQSMANGFVSYTPGSMYMTASNPTSQFFASPCSSQFCPSAFRTAPMWKRAMAAGVALTGLATVSTSAEAFPMDRTYKSYGHRTGSVNISQPEYALPAALGSLGLLVLLTIIGIVWSSRAEGSAKKSKPS